MSKSRLIAPLFVLAALVGDDSHAAPPPPQEVAEAQLRAINHRFVGAYVAEDADFMEALTDPDFLLIGRDGSWVDRAAFIADLRQPSSLDGASYDDVDVRLFGPVAVVHGVFVAVRRDDKVERVRYTDVYVWNGAAWRLVSGQNTLLKNGVDAKQDVGVAPAHAVWQGQDPTGDDHSVLTALNEQYVKAFREADVAWYGAHLAPDYAVVFGDGSFHDRGAALADFAIPYFEDNIRSFPVDKVNIRRFGDVALIHAENDYELKDGRKGINRYTDIWLKRDGKWLCVAAHITVHKAATK